MSDACRSTVLYAQSFNGHQRVLSCRVRCRMSEADFSEHVVAYSCRPWHILATLLLLHISPLAEVFFSYPVFPARNDDLSVSLKNFQLYAS